MSDSALKHIEHLSVTIGPRGSATPKEKEGHDYVHKVLSDIGCEPRVEEFLSSPSIYLQFALATGLMLVAEGLFLWIGRTANAQMGATAATVLGAAVMASVILELLGRDNPTRWFIPTAPSRNVIGVTPAGGEAQQKIAVIAHVDSHRTPLIWQSRRMFRIYRVLSTLGTVGLAALVVIFIIGILAPSDGLRLASLVPAALVVVLFLMVVQAHNTPYTAGANDNASGVGVMLALAGQLKQQPLPNTEVWWVASGCEEVGAYGSEDFVRRHKSEFENGLVVAVDNVAGKGTNPAYLTSEGIVIQLKYPDDGLALAEAVAKEHPELGGRPFLQQGAYTDGMPPLKAGLNTVTFLGFTPDGWIPDWHNKSDVFANVDADALHRAEQFVLALMQKFDAG
jgi:peptidase M28-like protein